MKEKFPSNYTVLLTGPPGVGKFEYCLDLVKYYLKKGEGVVFITTEKSPRGIKEKARAIGLDLDEYEGTKFIFIDIYSYSSGEKYERGLSVDNPANLNLITVNLGKASEIIGKPFRIIFDSLSTLFLHASTAEIKKFFGVLSSRVRTDYGFIIYTLQEEMHDAQTVIALKHIVDCVLEMKFEEGPPLKRWFRVHHAKGITTTPTWFEFEITRRGFEIIGEEKITKEAREVEKVRVKPAVLRANIIKIAIIGIVFLGLGGTIFQFMFKGETTFMGKVSGPTGEEEEEVAKWIDIYHLAMEKTVTVNGKSVAAYIDVKNRVDSKALKKGWLVMETPFYRIDLNLDHPYYLLFDKINDRDVLVYNDKVESPTDMLTGSTLGYADYDAENMVPFSSMALHDESGLEYHIIHVDKERGFLLVGTEGWDFQSADLRKGYDVEGEEFFGLFADKPYFIDSIEVNNLQETGYTVERGYRNPDGIVKDWVLVGEYSHACVKGGDIDHLNKGFVEPWYEVHRITGVRKPWHTGSAEFSKMFPDHVLVGNKLEGGIIFSLPQGKFRFDDSLGIYGAQVALEFLILVEKPQEAVAFTAEPVSREAFFYDVKDYNTIEGYPESMKRICERYSLECPDSVIDAHDWKTKRLAYVITLTKDWYDPSTNKPREEIWTLANEGLEEFKNYEDLIYKQMEATEPLMAKLMVR